MKKLIGNKAWLFFDTLEPQRIIAGTGSNQTAPRIWYFVVDRGNPSGVPPGFVQGTMFRSPNQGSQLTPRPGDRVMPINPQRFCKTSADYSVEQGSVDVGDDCSPGESILDGIIKISGSFSGFVQEDVQTGAFTDISMEILNRYFDIAEDDGAGVYAISPRTDDPMLLLLNLNSGVKVGQKEKWLLTPIIMPSFSSSIGMADAMNMDISWQQGEGRPLIYAVPKVTL